jgi:hypothetical protein
VEVGVEAGADRGAGDHQADARAPQDGVTCRS